MALDRELANLAFVVNRARDWAYAIGESKPTRPIGEAMVEAIEGTFGYAGSGVPARPIARGARA
jgi:hypothetical protein